MERVYHKLVRDRIPEIIQAQGETPVTRILSEEEYLFHLNQKLLEETQEYLKEDEVEELCDILEVIFALAAARGYSQQDLEKLRTEKARKNGAFRSRILLEKVLPCEAE